MIDSMTITPRDRGHEVWPGERNLTLDIAGLNDKERQEGSIFLGGSSNRFVRPGDQFDYSKIDTVLFEWGDPKAESVFACMLEHDNRSIVPICSYSTYSR